MITMPLLGWLILSAAGKPISFYGWQLPALVAENKGIAETAKGIQEADATVIYFLVGIYALTALCHHDFVRDKTFWRTLP
jgi:cytochrome b561